MSQSHGIILETVGIIGTIGNLGASNSLIEIHILDQRFGARHDKICVVQWEYGLRGEIPFYMRAQLVPLDGGPAVDIAKEMMLIGRQEDCDLRLDHKSVSKMHCVLVKTDGLILLRDLGSTNGTRVNGTRVRHAALLPNDKLSVANFHYKVLFGAALAAIAATDQTQHIEPERLNMMIADRGPMADSEPDQPVLKVQQNVLPDVYPDEKKG